MAKDYLAVLHRGYRKFVSYIAGEEMYIEDTPLDQTILQRDFEERGRIIYKMRKAQQETLDLLEQAVNFIVRSQAHKGCMNMEQIAQEEERLRKQVSHVCCAHNSSDVGVGFQLRKAIEMIEEAKKS